MESTMQTITGGLLMFQITQEEIGEIIDITEEMCNLEGWTEEALPLAQKRMAIIEKARSRPAPSPEPKFNSADLLLLAHDEWKRREERKHNHENIPWCAGFINGFLTDKKWAREMVDKIRTNGGEP